MASGVKTIVSVLLHSYSTRMQQALVTRLHMLSQELVLSSTLAALNRQSLAGALPWSGGAGRVGWRACRAPAP